MARPRVFPLELQTCNSATATRTDDIGTSALTSMIPVRGRADKGTIAPSRADDRGTWCALSAMRTVPPP